MHLAPLIRDLAIILGVAGPIGLLFHRLKQPLVLGYIFAGMLIGPTIHSSPLINDVPNIKVWAELGVICLMFSLGLEFSFRKLQRVGFSALITALLEVIFMGVAGFFCGHALGWTGSESLFLGAMLCISSTTIILKSFQELGLKHKGFSDLVLGVLIVEDLVAILILVSLSSFVGKSELSAWSLVASLVQLVLIVGGWMLVGSFLLPRFMQYVGKVGNSELLTLLSLGCCLLLVVFATQFQYSTALGAFIMGSILSESRESKRIFSLIDPLKDLFSAVFFVSLGMLVNPKIISEHFSSIALISIVTILGKITSASLGALLSGQSIKISAQVGLSLAQIGEFSFIIAALGISLGVTREVLLPIAISVSVLTTFTTPYCIGYSAKIGEMIETTLPNRLLQLMRRYARWVQERQTHSAGFKEFNQLFLKWCLNAILVSVIFRLAVHFLIEPPLMNSWMQSASWIFPGLGASPFLWAMLFLFDRSDHWRIAIGRLSLPRSLVILGFRLLTLALVAVLSLPFLPIGKLLICLGFLLCVTFLRFIHQVERSYIWMENQFLSNLSSDANDSALMGDSSLPLVEASWNQASLTCPLLNASHLAPWDAHLSHVQIYPDSSHILKPLNELDLRSAYGINVIAIQRGTRTLAPPSAFERLLPGDILLVLGNDDDLHRLRLLLAPDPSVHSTDRHLEEYLLRTMTVMPGSRLEQVSILDSGIREIFDCMLVGLERKERRIMNPSPALHLQAYDILWIVGLSENIERLYQDLKKADLSIQDQIQPLTHVAFRVDDDFKNIQTKI